MNQLKEGRKKERTKERKKERKKERQRYRDKYIFGSLCSVTHDGHITQKRTRKKGMTN